MLSQNGWSVPTTPALQGIQLKWYPVPGAPGERVRLRRGSVATCLLYFAALWNAEIEPLAGKPADEWGFAARNVRGSTTSVSNHYSGTAMDLDAAEHPLGTDTFSDAKTAKVHAILNRRVGGIRLGDVIRWGGDYSGRKDQMHEEINAHPALVKQLAKAIKKAGEDDMTPKEFWTQKIKSKVLNGGEAEAAYPLVHAYARSVSADNKLTQVQADLDLIKKHLGI